MHSEEDPLRSALEANATLMARIRELNMYDTLLYSEAKRLFAHAYTHMQLAEESLYQLYD